MAVIRWRARRKRRLRSTLVNKMMRAEEKPTPLFRRTIAGDLTLTLMLVMVAVFLGFGLASYAIILQRTTEAQVGQTAVLVDNLATALERPLATGDQTAVLRLTTSYEKAESIARILILDEAGATLYETAAPTLNQTDYTLTRQINSGDQSFGQVQITFSGQIVSQLQRNIFTILLGLLMVTLLAIVIVTLPLIRRFVSRPLNTLAEGMEIIAEGNYHYRLPAMTQAEVQFIAERASLMAEQIEQRDQDLRDLIDALEVRVAERTQDLLLASEIGQTVSQIDDLALLLPEAVELIRARFDLYHVQVYLLDETGDFLLLKASSGEIGTQLLAQGHRLPINLDSINGRAAAEKRTISVLDTATDLRYLPHPLLPDTYAETAGPLITGERVLGVLDLQSSSAANLSAERTPALEVMGELLSIAIESARRLQREAQLRADLAENGRFLDSVIENLPIMLFVKDAQDLRFIRWNRAGAALIGVPAEAFIGKTDYDFFPPDEAEFFVQKDRQTLSDGVLVDIPEERIETTDKGTRWLHTIKVPIMDNEGKPRYLLGISEDITERKEAEQMLADRIKELRLLNEIGRMMEQQPTIPEFAQFIATELPTGMRSPELCRAAVKLDDIVYGRPEALELPCQIVEGIRVGGNSIGRITIAYTEEQIFLNEESALIGEIGRRLSSYIESQRLLQQVQTSVGDLQTVTEISLAVVGAPNKQALLRTVVDLTQKRFGFYHVQIYLYDARNDELILTAGSGPIGQQLVAETPPFNRQTSESPVGRAANTRQPLLINDVAEDANFLSRALLPETQAQLLMPLAVGETLLGVLDIQSAQKRAFDAAALNIQTTLAAQVAVALQNADRLEQNQIALTELDALQRLMAREGWTEFLRQEEQSVRGYIANREKLEPYAGSNGGKGTKSPASHTFPLQVRGVTIGRLGVRQTDGRSLASEDRLFLESAAIQIAEALERSRLFAETEQARSQTETLFSGSESIVRAENNDDILKALVEKTALRQMERASLIFFDRPWQTEQPQTVTIAAVWRRDDTPLRVEVGAAFALEQYPITNLLDRRDPLIVEDVASDKRLPETTRTLLRDFLGMNSAIAIPLVAGDLWIGFVLCLATEPKRWTESQLRQIATLANQAATVAQTLRLFEDAQQRAEQEQILRRVSGQVYAALDAEAVLRTAAEEIGRALGLETFVYLEEGDVGRQTAVSQPAQHNGAE